MTQAEDDPLRGAVDEAITGNLAIVQNWREGRPGAWGYLAGQGVLAYRRRLGRRLTDEERRQLWASLWQALESGR